MNVQVLRQRWKKAVPMLLAVTVLGIVGGTALRRAYAASDCCAEGSSCCHPGAACCAGHKHASNK